MNGKFLRKNWKNYNQHNNNNIMPTLYLIPTTLGETALDTILPAQNDQIVISLKYFIVENIRTPRRFLKLKLFLSQFVNIGPI